MAAIETFIINEIANPFSKFDVGVVTNLTNKIIPDGGEVVAILYGNLVGGQTVYTSGAPAGGATLSWLV